MGGLLDLDKALFAKINGVWTSDFMNWLFPTITDLHKDKGFLVAALAMLAYWVWRKRTTALKWLLVLVLSVGLSDFISYRLVKSVIVRDRPQYSGIPVVLRTHDHTGPSFPSIHSANMFAAASTLSIALPAGATAFYMVAILVAYSRVYVGVHFPLDVIGGALMGALIAFAVRRALRKLLKI